MTLNPLLRPLGIAAAILGTCQGIVWSVLTILAIRIRIEAWEWNQSDQTNSFANLVYKVIFFPEKKLEEELIMNADVFLGFAAFYLPLSLIWAIVSMILLWELANNVFEYITITFNAWCVVTGIQTIFDFIVIILFAVDLGNVTNLEKLEADVFLIQTTIGVVMTIAARGYFLVIGHAIFVVLFAIWANRIIIEDFGKTKLTMSPFSRWHTTGTIPRVPVEMQNDQKKSFENQETLQIRYPAKRISIVSMDNGLHRPKSMENNLFNVLRQKVEFKNNRVSKTGPPPPPKPVVVRPNSHYY